MTALDLPQILRLPDLAALRTQIAQALGQAQEQGAALFLDARPVAQIDTAAIQLLLAVMADAGPHPTVLAAPDDGVVATALGRLCLDRILQRDGDDLTFANPGDAA